jgi:hypothetical protein
MTRKRSLQFLAPVVLVAVLGACGSDKKTSSTAATTPATAATTTVASAGTPTTAAATGDTTATTATTAAGSSATVAPGDSTAGGAGAGTAFCQFEEDINTAVGGVDSPADVVDVFKQFQPRMAQWIADAPADMKANAQTLVDAATKAVASGDPTSFGTADVDAAGTAIDSYCGISG